MQPHEIAAHRIADAFETIAREVLLINDEQLNTLFHVFHGHGDFRRIVAAAYAATAERYRATAPFVPCTEMELALMNAQVVEEYADQSTRDMVRDHFDRPDWQLRAEWDDRCEWDGPEPHNDN